MSRESTSGRPLFERYAGLARGLPLVELAELPTPLRPLSGLAALLGLDAQSLWLKDDGPSSRHYGGNKVRKLELLLAEARERGAKAVMTFGYAGSNHATATAVHAARLGLGSISILLPQENAEYLRKNLLVSSAVGAELHQLESKPAAAAAAIFAFLRHRLRSGKMPYIIPPGGSSPRGSIAFVNAAFELAGQLEAQGRAMPGLIYTAGGSLGTMVGLALGCAALGAPTRIVAVRVVDEEFVNPRKAGELWQKTLALLRRHDASFPDLGALGDRIEIRGEFFGGLYARVTKEAEEARALALEKEALALDVTYTSKTLACLLADARAGRLREPALFWNTCNSSDLAELASRASVEELPAPFRRYFA